MVEIPELIIDKLWNKINYKVQVNWLLYNKKKNYIIKYGSSRPNSKFSYHTSTHAEIKAILKYRLLDNKKNIIIIIFKLDLNKKILPAFSCLTCDKYIKKLNIQELMYTMSKNTLFSCLIQHPQLCFGLSLKFKKI